MRIVFVTTFPTAESGGAGRVAHELAAASARTHDVLLVTPGERTEWIASPPGEPTRVRVATRGDGDVQLPDLRTRDGLEALLQDFRPDVVHAHDFSPLSLWFQDWAHRNGRPFAVTLHCLPSQAQAFGSLERPRLTRWMGESPLFPTFIRLFLHRCDGVIALNAAMVEDLRQFGYRGPLYQVPNGRDLAAYRDLPPADITQPVKELLFVGSFARRKNQRYLLEMMAHLTVPARLVLVGETLEPGYLEELRAYVRDRALGNVDIVGPVPHTEIPHLLRVAHVFVSASKLEVQSLAVIEALASGTPVVGLTNETVAELVDDAVGRRLPADASPAEFAREVEAICRMSPEHYVALCRAGQERVRSLDWRAVVEQNSRVYAELAAVSSGAGRKRAPLWTPWLVAASALRYGIHGLPHSAQGAVPGAGVPTGGSGSGPSSPSPRRAR